jgi:cell division initiation protein
MLTPNDIEQKTFSTALRGYDLDEVDDFLDQVVATIRDLQEELAEARSSAAKAPEPVADESAVGRALIAAQSAADQILASAREGADRSLAEAREEAERLLEEAKEQANGFIAARDARKAEAEAEMQMLSEHVSHIRTQLALLATAVADKLDEMDALIAAESAGSGQGAEPESWGEEEGVTMAGEEEEVLSEEEESVGGDSLFGSEDSGREETGEDERHGDDGDGRDDERHGDAGEEADEEADEEEADELP